LGGTTTHHQERKTTVSTASGICHTVIAICRYRGRVGTAVPTLSHLVFVTPLLVSVAIVEELELQFQLFHIWYLSHHYCYLSLTWKSWNCSFNSFTSGICHTIIAICRYRERVGTAVPTLSQQIAITV
jgi:hypothetical protein